MTPPKSVQHNNFVFAKVPPRVILESHLLVGSPEQGRYPNLVQRIKCLEFTTVQDTAEAATRFIPALWLPRNSKQQARFQSRLCGGLLSQVGSGGDAASLWPRVHRQAENKGAY